MRKADGALKRDEAAIVKALLARGWRNQDIQALLNTERKATINSARITEVKQNKTLTPASDDAVDFFIKKKNRSTPRRG